MSDENQVVSSFDDLMAPPTIPINITTEYGRKITVNTALLSYDEWSEAARKIPMPKPPLNLENPNKPGEFLPNPSDPAHLEKMRQWQDNAAIYQVITALEKGGLKIPGASPIDKVKAFRKTDNAIMMGIIDGVTRAHQGRKVRVQELADSFRKQPLGESEDTGDDAVEHQNEYRVEPIAAE